MSKLQFSLSKYLIYQDKYSFEKENEKYYTRIVTTLNFMVLQYVSEYL